MFKTRLTELLGVEYPIIGGAMAYLSTAELAAAASDLSPGLPAPETS